MSQEQNNNNDNLALNGQDAEFQANEIDIRYHEGEEAKAQNGDTIDDGEFQLVQQNKKIHDTKFSTKPTTFFKDAMHRFSKNHSSVVGGLILGVLFLLAIILPIDGILPYNVSGTNNYETNLAPKVLNAGSGFWDGSTTSTNVPYPYDSDGKYTGSYYDSSVVLKVDNIHTGYSDVLSSDSKGGYMRVVKSATTSTETGYAYSYAYTYDTANTYTVTMDLGWKNLTGYVKPKFSLLFLVSNGVTTNYINLFDWTDAYGEETAPSDDEATVSSFGTKTYNLTELIKNNTTIASLYPGKTTFNASLGVAFQTDTTSNTALFVKDFTITSNKVSEKTSLAKRSFSDASTCVNQTKKNADDSYNQSYWASNSAEALGVSDASSTRCNIVYDQYKIIYGYRASFQVASTVLADWNEKGYIKWDSKNPTYGTALTDPKDSTKNAVDVYDDVYVSRVDSAIGDNSYLCTILMYKYLGYSSMPVHVLGTDSKGRDILKYDFLGLRTSLLLGVIVSAINILFGVIWGSISGYFGGKLDLFMERIVDILSGMPWIVLMTVLSIKMKDNRFFAFALALCLTGWIGTESVTRSQFYRYRDREYVLAARTLGAKSPRLIFRHILPNAIGTIITSSALMIPSVIFSEATISYLGLGLTGTASLGVILSESQAYLSNYPYQLVVPAVIISLLMICFNLFGNGLRDAFNPSLKGTE